MNKPYHECPSFMNCSCNVCPLDTDYPSKEIFALPGEEKCKATKAKRMEIGIKYGLKYQGLTETEFNRRLQGQRIKDEIQKVSNMNQEEIVFSCPE